MPVHARWNGTRRGRRGEVDVELVADVAKRLVRERERVGEDEGGVGWRRWHRHEIRVHDGEDVRLMLGSDRLMRGG